MSTLRELSKSEYSASARSIEEINCGSLQRIADACDVMARNYRQMQSDLDYWKKRVAERDRELAKLRLSHSALKGVVARLKNKQQASAND